MPSVITMHSGIWASMASMTAALVKAAGTNTTDTSAPVAAMVSATVPKTGTSWPPRSMVWPALRGLVPPTTEAPAASIRAPCLLPSEPGMPWIMIRLWAGRKIAPSSSLRGQAGAGQLRGPAGRVIHCRNLLDDTDGRLGQDAASLGRGVAVHPHHDGAVHPPPPGSQQADGRDDPVGHRVAGGDAAEHVDQHGTDARVGQDDLQAVGHDL